MKNKTSRVNKMKLKKAIVASLAILFFLHSQVAELHLVWQQLNTQSRKILLKQIQTCRLNRMKS